VGTTASQAPRLWVWNALYPTLSQQLPIAALFSLHEEFKCFSQNGKNLV